MNTKLYAIAGPWRGLLAILPRPRGGDWLEDEVAGWKKAGLEVVVSALTPDEIETMDLGAEHTEVQKQGLVMVSFPIPDRSTPESDDATRSMFRRLGMLLSKGRQIGIHCRQGIGRSSLIAATLLVLVGIDPAEAWRRIELARGCPVPDTAEQKVWVARFTQAALARETV